MYLPEELVMDILVRLPVKSLIRFKYVCKSWYALIKNPSFISQHLSHPYSSHNNDSILVFDRPPGDYNPKVSLLHSDKNFQFFEYVTAPIFDGCLANDIQIYGPCNGIVCLYRRCSNKTVLWNPATKENRVLPLPPSPFDGSRTTACGIGFDSTRDEYKVVHVLYDFQRRGKNVGVYTLSTDSWRKVDTIVPADIISFHFSTCVKGFYYWWALDRLDEYGCGCYVIISFNLSNEVFQKMLPPPLTRDDGNESLLDKLVELNGSIAAICTCKAGAGAAQATSLTIWVRNEDGNMSNNKWIAHLTIDLNFGINRVLGLCKNGDILMEGSGIKGRRNLTSYNPHTRQMGNHGEYFESKIVVYKESLVPLSKKIENEQKHR